jgi:hypothetical protein
MLRSLFVCWCFLLVGFCSGTLNAADKTIGKLFIKAADSTINGQQFADPELASTVKDMKLRHGKFVVVDDESQADFLIVVLERKTELRSPIGPATNYRMISATFSVKDGSSWKPVCKLTNGSGFNAGSSWGIAAGRVINEAEKCAKDNAGK